MKFLAIIPARYSSSRFPGKPLADIGGKPMIQRVYERVSASVRDCWVATDDSRIRDKVKEFGGLVVMTSPDHRSGTDRCAEAYKKIVAETEQEFDAVINVQGDEPFISADHIKVIKSLFEYSEVQIGTLVKRFSENEDLSNPDTPKVVLSGSGDALYFSRSVIPYLRGVEPSLWASTHPYYKHIGLYAYRSGILGEITKLPPSALELAESLEQLRWLENGYRIRAGIVSTESIAVDTPEDLLRAVRAIKD